MSEKTSDLAVAESGNVQGPAFPAEFTVHWPSGPVHACSVHARQLQGLAGFLGAHVGVTTAPDGAQCQNCMNEFGATEAQP